MNSSNSVLLVQLLDHHHRAGEEVHLEWQQTSGRSGKNILKIKKKELKLIY